MVGAGAGEEGSCCRGWGSLMSWACPEYSCPCTDWGAVQGACPRLIRPRVRHISEAQPGMPASPACSKAAVATAGVAGAP